MRPARAAAAKNTPAKPGRQPSFSQSAIALATATSHWALSKSSDSPMVPAGTRQGHPVTPPRDARKEGSQMRPARAAAENKNTTRSSSAPKKKLSGASLFLAEMVRRRRVSETELNVT